MRIDLAGLAARLERGIGEEALRRAAERGAGVLAEGVRARLSGTPGEAHEAPWAESGALRDSVGVAVEGDGDGARAVVGTSDPAAVPQEMGTMRMPARPFLAPVAGEVGEEAARTAGTVVRAALRGETAGGIGEGGDEGGEPGITQASATGNGAGQMRTPDLPHNVPGGFVGFPSSEMPIAPAIPIAYNPGDYAPEGALAGPFGERVVDLNNVPDNAKDISKYRVFFYDQTSGICQVGFSFPGSDFTINPTTARRGAATGTENGMVVVPAGSPPQTPGKNPVLAIRIGYSGGGNGQPYFKVYNSAGQEISPVTGRVITNQALGHYPLDPSKTARKP